MGAFRITFNVMVDDREKARDAATHAMHEAGEEIEIVRFGTPRLAPSVYGVTLWFRAADANVAADYLKRLQRLPGQPPSDAYTLHL
ncbi:hypothetical protein [Terracoccus sp. 273MFTsu3.1]|uniref:hypothetical protein n=1 Tax=Terracoccus sp. 273MFTsu3.1 TaxID=1172188 RepID=UPI000373CC9E|nr:hypothetical protein [Terracoccus sp. 273MFTsu3.1]